MSPDPETLLDRQQTFGYSQEDTKILMAPMATTGQEAIGSTWALAKMNMFLHGIDNATIEWGDTLNNPKLIEDDSLQQFNVVVANPPFSLDKWGAEDAQSSAPSAIRDPWSFPRPIRHAGK